MRIVLLAIHPYPSPQAVPLANALLKGYAQMPGVVIDLHEALPGDSPAELAAALLAGGTDAVGLSLYVWNRALALATAAELRHLRPGLFLFAGGPEATAAPQELLAASVLDAVVVGEGEAPFAALCACLAAGKEPSGIPGLLQRGTTDTFIPQGEALDLDVIPSPWLNGVLDARRTPGVLWQLARGCSFGCEFCYDARDRFGVRRVGLARVEAELRHFVACGVRQVFVLDSTFNQDLPRAKTILRLIREIAPRIHFHFEVRSEFLDRELAQLFAAITCSLQIGLQSADPTVLKRVGRVFRREDFTAKIALLNKSGATFGFDLMIGLPGDTLAGFRASLDFALGLYPNQLDIFPLALLPGTPLAGRAAALGLAHAAAPPYTVHATPNLPAADLATARQLASACDIFYSRGKAVAWFNGVVRALGETPATFLAGFADWLVAKAGGSLPEPERCSEEQIWQWQRAFLTERFRGPGKRQLAIVLDLVDYHHHYAQALQTPPLTPSRALPRGEQLLERPWRLAAQVRFVPFRHDILALLAAGEPQPRRFAELFPPSPCTALIFATGDGVQTELLEGAYIDLLRQLDGRTPAGRLVARLRLERRDAADFLRIAAGAGMIL